MFNQNPKLSSKFLRLYILRRVAILVLTILFIPFTCQATASSELNIDYVGLAKSEFLGKLVLELEPKVLVYYGKYNLSQKQKIRGLEGMARSLGNDMPYKPIITDIKRVSPDTLLRFLELDKNKYPRLWDIGELERIQRKLKESERLYKALHGKDYEEK
jgi:hypothetical protein